MKLSALNYYKSNPNEAYAAGGAFKAKKGAQKAATENKAKITGGAYIAAQGAKKYKNQYVAAWAAKWAK
ncbi:MAG: hypothetical protein K6A44_06305 [bacterium]|nr:hypothetical protein [bacterium]